MLRQVFESYHSLYLKISKYTRRYHKPRFRDDGKETFVVNSLWFTRTDFDMDTLSYHILAAQYLHSLEP